jgi:hypothetical protein
MGKHKEMIEPTMALKEEIEQASRIFNLEYMMFTRAIEKYSSSLRHNNQFLKNIYMESILLHARNLIDFFYKDEEKQKNNQCTIFSDEIIAQKIFPAWRLEKKINNTDLLELINIFQNINIYLDHMNHKRFERFMHPNVEEWDFFYISDKIINYYQKFLEELPDEIRVIWESESYA